MIAKGSVRSDYFESGSYLEALSTSSDYSAAQFKALTEGRALICVFIQLPVDRLRQGHTGLKDSFLNKLNRFQSWLTPTQFTLILL